MALRNASGSTVFSRFDPQRLLPVRERKKKLPGKRYDFHEKVNAETGAFVEGLDKTKDIEILEWNWNDGINLERDYLNE